MKMQELASFVWRLFTGDMSPEQRAAGLRFLGNASWRAVVIVAVAMAYGVPGVVLGVFARAGEVEEKIKKAIEPLALEQSKQLTTLAQLVDQQKDQLANAAASDIRYLMSKRCAVSKTDMAERDRLQKQIDDRQREYYKYRNTYYNYGCGDV